MPDTTPPPPKPKPSRAAQDQRLANDIAAARVLLETARIDAEIAPLLAARGYDAAKLAQGLAAQQAAQDAYTARQTALGLLGNGATNADAAQTTARQNYADFRETGRAVAAVSSNAAAARATLGLNGKVQADAQKFITQARASYAAARQAPHAAQFATYGYPEAILAALESALDALEQAQRAHTAADSGAQDATRRRDAAFKALSEWLAPFKRIAKVALRARPDLLARLGL